MPGQSAIELLVYKPGLPIPAEERGVHENLWLKQCFHQYLSIGVFIENSILQYYYFEHCDDNPRLYSSLALLIQDLPPGLEDLFESMPQLFVMGHCCGGGSYGLETYPAKIVGQDFDHIITDFKAVLATQDSEIVVNLEACNTDNVLQAIAAGYEKTFLQRLSATHPDITFCGTGPWDPSNSRTGNLASGGFPALNVAIRGMAGSVWKYGSSVVFYDAGYQFVAIKKPFSSIQSIKELKINTLACAKKILVSSSKTSEEIERVIRAAAEDRQVLNINDLCTFFRLHDVSFESDEVRSFRENEARITEEEQHHYVCCVQDVLQRADSGELYTDRDLLIIALGLQERYIFEGNNDLLDRILTDKALLQLVMVTCGKVLLAGPTNDMVIDMLLAIGVSINSVDGKGMSALHYAVTTFYDYTEVPLNLIRKLLDSGARLEQKDFFGRTPVMLALAHSRETRVAAGEKLLALLEQALLLAQGRLRTVGFFTAPSLQQQLQAECRLKDKTTVDPYRVGAIVPYKTF